MESPIDTDTNDTTLGEVYPAGWFGPTERGSYFLDGVWKGRLAPLPKGAISCRIHTNPSCKPRLLRKAEIFNREEVIEWLEAGIPYAEGDTLAHNNAKVRAHNAKLEEIARRKVRLSSG